MLIFSIFNRFLIEIWRIYSLSNSTVSPTALTETRRTSSDGHTEGMEKAQESDAESLRSTEAAQSCHYHSGTNSYM